MKDFRTLFLALILAAGCGAPLDIDEKTACRDDGDCLGGWTCKAERCIEAPVEGDTTDVASQAPRASDELPGAREAVMDSIGGPCESDAECADGLHCIDNACVCCTLISPNPFGSSFRCDAEVTPSAVDVCIPRQGRPDDEELPELGADCSEDWDCAGDLTCAGKITCEGGGTFQGCDGETIITKHCMCCVRLMSADDIGDAFDCSDEPAFYRAHCE